MHQDAQRSSPRFWLPAGTVLFITALCWAAVTLWVHSQPEAAGNDAWLLWSYALPALGIVWIVRLLWSAAGRKRYRRQHWPLVAAPFLILLTALATAGDLPFKARWAFARPAFEEAVTSVHHGTSPTDFVGHNLRTYRIQAMSPNSDSNIFFTTQWNGVVAVGMVWSDEVNPEQQYEYYRLRHVAGNWYRFEI